MGNSQLKSSNNKTLKQSTLNTERKTHTSQFSLSHFVGNLSGRSFVSVTSNQSVYSTSRPWSRVSRRRWNEATLTNPLDASKTAWPVAHKESIFIPEFPITTELLKKDFEIHGVLAKGAFGEVCKVKKTSVNKDYALKVLSKAQVISESAVKQVKEEAHIQEVCGHHPFIVGAISRWQTKKRLYIVSEYVPGGELLTLLEKYGRLPEEVVKIFIAEIAVAIDFLHNAGVIYRDLKPENILLDGDLHVQLTDFGLSKWLSIGSRTTTLCGTLQYMAPEVLSREPYGHAVDWWSLGVLACRMLTNQFPTPAVGTGSVEAMDVDGGNYSDEVVNGVIQRTSTDPPPGTLPEEASSLSPAARALLMRLLEREPKHRLRTLRQLQQTAFYMGFNFEPVKAKKVSPREALSSYFPENTTDCPNNELQPDFKEFNQDLLI